MNEPTTDEKIQQLVRAVLDAVDSRLDGVRHELAVFSGDVERRHHEVLDALAALEQRVVGLERTDGERSSAGSTVRNRLEHLQTQLDSLEHEAHSMPAGRHHEPPAADLSAISKPLYSTPHITTQLPIVTDPAIQEITSLAIPPAVPPTMTSPTSTSPTTTSPTSPAAPVAARSAEPEAESHEITEEIDVERLTNLLNERLGHLTLPPRDEE